MLRPDVLLLAFATDHLAWNKVKRRGGREPVSSSSMPGVSRRESEARTDGDVSGSSIFGWHTCMCVVSLRARALHMAASGCMWLLQEICMCSNLMRGQDSNAPNPDTYSRRGTGLNGLHWGDMQSARSPLRVQA